MLQEGVQGRYRAEHQLIEEVQRLAGERDYLLGLEECYKKVCMVGTVLYISLIVEVQRVAGERDDLLGLEECYKKVCKVGTGLNI